MVAVQMVEIHHTTMMIERLLNHVDNIAQKDVAKRALDKLARIYSSQLNALKRYFTGGQQKVTWRHVTVNAGKQGIVVARGTWAARADAQHLAPQWGLGAWRQITGGRG